MNDSPRVVSLPFERRHDESIKAFTAFTEYLNMGAQRSLEAVARKLGKSKTVIERWSRRHSWVLRIDAHGKHMASLMRQAELHVIHEFALDRAKRESAQMESEWQMRCEALDLAREAIRRWKDNANKYGTLEGIARLLELASKLGRLSCGMDGENTKKTVQEVRTISIEFKAALEKAYGKYVDIDAKPVESAAASPADTVQP
jgi:hypothetical protein